MQTQDLLSVSPVFYKGALTLCSDWWHFDSVLINYDRFYFIVEGECVIDVNGVKNIAKRGQLFFLPVGSEQTLYTEDGKTVKKYWFHCSLPCKEKDFSEICELPLYIEVEDFDFIEGIFQGILALENDMSLSAKLQQKAEILKLLAYYTSAAKNSEVSVEHDVKISYILSYIEQNLYREIPLEELSALVHFHPAYFIRYFKASVGKPPISYINERRTKLAQSLLLSESETVQSISRKTGFQSPYYFSRFFKKKTGMSPTEYRNVAIKRHRAK